MPQAQVVGHRHAAKLLATGERIMTYAEIAAQGISIPMPRVEIDKTIDEGDVLEIGGLKLDVWHTPGHAPAQLSFRMGDLLFSGDNIYRDGCVGNIDAHHGSDLPSFIKSLKRIRDSDVEWLLPSHGPIFRKDDAMLQATIDRLDNTSTWRTSGRAPSTGRCSTNGTMNWRGGKRLRRPIVRPESPMDSAESEPPLGGIPNR